ncbi:MAG: type III pantothenate kinase [Nitrospiraceae bacterium]|nr:type III pantothenate kinase [Nitrospiraceae bacterium]
MNIMAIDIGNSSINIGFFRGLTIVSKKISARPALSSSGYETAINKILKEDKTPSSFEGSIISSVVPDNTENIKNACKSLCKKEPLILNHKMNTGMTLDIREPEKLGVDRIAACAGACGLFGPPVVVIDFGTATTINFVVKDNVYKGGAIMPGLQLMKNSLASETAQLPDVNLTKPKTAVGRDTGENILSGIIYGTAGAVEKIIKEAEKNGKDHYKVVITGGNHEIMLPFLSKIDFIEPDLVLKGLKFIYERNV